jgi:hypothetical protein
MGKEIGVTFSSEWHDPVSKIQLKKDPSTGELYHHGSYYEESRDASAVSEQHWAVRKHVSRLSKDPVLRSSQIRWLRARVNPFSGKDLLRYATTAKDPYGRACAMNDLDAFGLLHRSFVPSLARIARTDRFGENRAMALSLIAKLRGSAAEGMYLESLGDPSFRYKFSPISLINDHGTSASVPAMAKYVKKAVRRKRTGFEWDSDVSVAVKFLNRFLDRHPAVVDAFQDVVRYWHNLDYDEARCVEVNARYIGIRVLSPVEPEESDGPERVTIQASWGKRRLWKTGKK